MKIRRLVQVFIGFIVLFFIADLSNAALSRVGEYVYDDIADQYWVADLSQFYDKTLAEQQALFGTFPDMIDEDNLSSWRLADQNDLINLIFQPNNTGYYFEGHQSIGLNSENRELALYGRIDVASFLNNNMVFSVKLPEFGSSQWGSHVGTEVVFPGQIMPHSVTDGERFVNLGSWVVADVLVVPVPPSILLLGFGLLGLAGVSRKKCSTDGV